MSSPDLSPLLDALARELDRYRLDPQSTHAVRAAAHALACEFAGLTKADRDHPAVPGVQELARGLWDAGFLGRAVPPEDLALAGDLSARGWPGLLGAMLFTPCWQWPAAPALDAAPDWLWGHFVDWVCVAPCAATAVGAADLHLGQLEILAEAVQRWAGRNIAAPCVKAAVETLERHRGLTSPLRSTLSLRRWQAARAAIFAKQLRHHTDRAAAPAAYARAGRLLRVGVVAADWGESLASRARLPWLAALDPATFTVHLFADVARYDALEKTFRVFAAKLHVFSAKNDERIEAVRAADLDVLIFCGRLAGAHEQQLAMHRLSPLQAVTDECPWALSLPEIDLHLTGSAADAAELGERIGLLPAPGLDWDADTVPVTLEGPSRAELGLPVAGPVFVSAPSLEHLGPETLRAWVALLRANADSAFLLLPPAGSDTFVLEQLFAALQASDGVDASRFVISLGDPRGCFRHGDVYLDTFPYSAPTPLQAALAAGLPAVAWEGATHRSRTGARVLRALGQDDWVAADEAGYVARAQRLIGDAALRATVRIDIEDRAEIRRGFGDAPLASQHFGNLIACAYDLLAEGERLPALVAAPTPTGSVAEFLEQAEDALVRQDAAAALLHAGALLTVEPESTAARSILGRAHLLAGNAHAAATCFLSALRGRENDAQLWLDAGSGLRAKKEFSDAIQAYETGLRIDSTRIEGWIAIAELARANGVDDLAEDAIGVARRIDARDPRLAAFNA